MLARISTSLCVGPLFIGPPLVTSGVGHLTLRGPLRRSGYRQAPSSVLRATRRPQARSPWPGRLFSRIIPRNRALPFGVSWVVWTGPIRGFTQRRGYGVFRSSLLASNSQATVKIIHQEQILFFLSLRCPHREGRLSP